MREDTPLNEVAHYLSQETADRLFEEAPYIQRACLETVRMAVVDLEERGTMLDPFHLGAFLDGVVRGRLQTLGENLMESQDQVAAFFMERKGYAGIKPRDITKLHGVPCWYYVYDLEDGVLEIEVDWSDGEWSTRVTTFSST